MVARGYTDYEHLKERIERVLEELENTRALSEDF
jgi:aconitase B